MMDNGYRHYNAMKKGEMRAVCFARYKDAIIRQTAQTRRLTQYPLTPFSAEQRSAAVYSPEELKRQAEFLAEKYAYSLAHPNEIPDSFFTGWTALPQEIIISYYIALNGVLLAA